MYKNFFKRLIDFVIALCGTPFLLIIFLVVAPLIYLEDKGPVFYNATRRGKDGKDFKMYKFRSMYVNSPDLRNEDGSTYNGENDPRVTKIGKILRKTSLDETPQLLNILKGDMSIIGPRPALWNQDDLIEERDKYNVHSVLPGLTGWAQINGRDELEIPVKAKFDGEYIEKMSLLFDIKIFFGTIIKVFKHDGIVEGKVEKEENKEEVK